MTTGHVAWRGGRANVAGRRRARRPPSIRITGPDRGKRAVGSRTETVRRSGFSVELRLFGTPEARLEGEPVGLSAQKYHLLGVLVICGDGGIRTADLLGLLWAEGTESERRARLRQALYQIRSTLDCASEIVRSCRQDRLVLDGSAVTTDLDGFRRLLEERRAGEAVALLESGFLAGARQGMTDALATWIRDEERGLRAEARAAATCLWTSSTRRADWRAAEEAARALITLDPMEQANLRRLMRVLAISGQVDQAQAEEASFVERARSIDPEWTLDPRTRALKEGLPGLARERVERVHFRRLPGLADPPLLGREREMAALEALLQHPPEGRAQFIVISGESGVGKTRLAQEAVAIASPPGSRVLSARCRERQRELPLTPLITAVTRGEVEEEIQRLPSLWREVLLEVAPELRPSAEPDQGGRLVQPSQLRRLQAEGFHRLLQELAATGPVILFLDDLHWADADTLLVLDHLRSRWSAGSLSVVATVGGGGGLSSCLREDQGEVYEVSLTALNSASAEALLGLAAEPDMPLGTATRIQSLADGNPFHIIEFARATRLSREIGLADAGSTLIPLRVRKQIEAELRLLSPNAREVFDYIICSLEPLRVEDLTRATELSRSCVNAAIRELGRRDWTRWEDAGVTPRRELARLAVLESFSADRHARLAQRILDGRHQQELSSLPGNAPALSRLGHYHLIAGNIEAAKRTALGAADVASGHQERMEAVGLLETVQARMNDDLELAMALGGLYSSTSEPQRAVSYFKEAEHALELRGESLKSTEVRLRGLEARLRLPDVDLEDLARSCQDIQRLAQTRGWSTLLAETIHLRVRIADAAFDVGGAARLIAEARKLAAEWPKDLEARIVLKATEALEALFARPVQGLEAAREAVRLAGETDDLELKLRTHNLLFLSLLHFGLLSTDEGTRVVQRIHQLSAEADDALHWIFLQANRAVWLIDTWRYDGAILALNSILSEGGVHAPAPARAPLHLNLATAHYRLRNIDQAESHFELGRSLVGPGASSSAKAAAIGLRGLLALERGSISQAQAAVDDLTAIPRPWHFDPTVPTELKSRVLWHTRKEADALDLIQSTLDEMQDRMPFQRISLWDLMANLGLRSGKEALAVEAWNRGLEIAEEVQVDPMLSTIGRRLRALARRN
jgi:DNA-binding SARP family transcriptional activator/tetratricopeptide (TPR) repeat protein